MVSEYSTLVQFQRGTRNFGLYTIIISTCRASRCICGDWARASELVGEAQVVDAELHEATSMLRYCRKKLTSYKN